MKESLFALIRDYWDLLLTSGQPMDFLAGQTLFYEGHRPYGFFILAKGKVRFTKKGVPCLESHIWHSPRGEVLGLMELAGGDPFCCSCAAKEDCQVVFISKTQLAPYFKKGEAV